MPRCPNPKCNYQLVLLESKGKYKCALCGKLYSQKEIDFKEFREFNEKERTKAKKEHRKEGIRERYKRWVKNDPKKAREYKKNITKKIRKRFLNV